MSMLVSISWTAAPVSRILLAAGTPVSLPKLSNKRKASSSFPASSAAMTLAANPCAGASSAVAEGVDLLLQLSNSWEAEADFRLARCRATPLRQRDQSTCVASSLRYCDTKRGDQHPDSVEACRQLPSLLRSLRFGS